MKCNDCGRYDDELQQFWSGLLKELEKEKEVFNELIGYNQALIVYISTAPTMNKLHSTKSY